MKRTLTVCAALCAAIALNACAGDKVPPPPVPGGEIGTLTRGKYVCELPGDATGPVGKELPEYDFEVVNSSSYRAGGISGSYLYTGDRVIMTGGKLKGLKFLRVSSGFLRQLGDDGTKMVMRCVLISHNH
jgi:hypothetical protein